MVFLWFSYGYILGSNEWGHILGCIFRVTEDNFRPLAEFEMLPAGGLLYFFDNFHMITWYILKL